MIEVDNLNTKTDLIIKNKIQITGRLLDSPVYRTSPAGAPIAQLILWHESKQDQVVDKSSKTSKSDNHKVEFSLPVSVASKQLISELKALNLSKSELRKYWFEITGYLAQRLYANGEQKLVLHAQEIKINY